MLFTHTVNKPSNILRIIFGFGLFFSLFVSAPIYAAEPLIIGMDNSYPPYMQGNSNIAEGLYPDLIQAVFKRMGMDVNVKALPWKRAVSGIDKGEIGLGGLYKNDERLKKYDFSDAIYEETLVIYFNKQKPFRFESLKDLDGHVIGINSGWSYGGDFDKARADGKFKVKELKTNTQNLKMLAAGRVDAVIIDSLSSDLIVRENKLGQTVDKLPTSVTVNGAFIAFHKNARMQPLLKRFNETLSEMKTDGGYQNIIENFILSNTQPEKK